MKLFANPDPDPNPSREGSLLAAFLRRVETVRIEVDTDSYLRQMECRRKRLEAEGHYELTGRRLLNAIAETDLQHLELRIRLAITTAKAEDAEHLLNLHRAVRLLPLEQAYLVLQQEREKRALLAGQDTTFTPEPSRLPAARPFVLPGTSDPSASVEVDLPDKALETEAINLALRVLEGQDPEKEEAALRERLSRQGIPPYRIQDVLERSGELLQARR